MHGFKIYGANSGFPGLNIHMKHFIFLPEGTKQIKSQGKKILHDVAETKRREREKERGGEGERERGGRNLQFERFWRKHQKSVQESYHIFPLKHLASGSSRTG